MAPNGPAPLPQLLRVFECTARTGASAPPPGGSSPPSN